MSVDEDIAAITRQEAELRFTTFDYESAWTIGNALRQLAVTRHLSAVIDIRRFGHPHEPLFYTAIEGTTPDNARWVQRKSNVVARFHRSSYAVGLSLSKSGVTLEQQHSLSTAEYATHGGSFPIHVVNAGIIGSITVSGLPQRQDHNLVVEALCAHLNKDHNALKLT